MAQQHSNAPSAERFEAAVRMSRAAEDLRRRAARERFTALVLGSHATDLETRAAAIERRAQDLTADDPREQ